MTLPEQRGNGMEMSIRDYFAGTAMQAFIQSTGASIAGELANGAPVAKVIALISYAIADEMMTVRDKEPSV